MPGSGKGAARCPYKMPCPAKRRRSRNCSASRTRLSRLAHVLELPPRDYDPSLVADNLLPGDLRFEPCNALTAAASSSGKPEVSVTTGSRSRLAGRADAGLHDRRALLQDVGAASRMGSSRSPGSISDGVIPLRVLRAIAASGCALRICEDAPRRPCSRRCELSARLSHALQGLVPASNGQSLVSSGTIASQVGFLPSRAGPAEPPGSPRRIRSARS